MPSGFNSSSRDWDNLCTKPEKRTYSLPEFQRDFSWKKENLDLFLQDLEASLSRTGPDQSMFIGQILLYKKGSNSNDVMIIDGQQRFVTLNILLCGMRDILQEEKCGPVEEEGGIPVPSRVDAKNLYIRIQKLIFTEEGDPKERLVLRALDVDDERPQDYLDLKRKVQQNNPVSRKDADWEHRGEYTIGRPPTNNIKEAKKIVRNWLDRILTISEEPPTRTIDRIRELMKLLTFIEQKIHCTDSTSSNYGLAYRSFYTINSRGINLTPGELIRASLAARAKEISDTDAKDLAQERIRKMLSRIDSVRSGDSDYLTDFFEYFYRSTKGGTSDKALVMDYWSAYISTSSEDEFITHIKELCTGEVNNYCSIRTGHESLPANRDLFDFNRQKLTQHIPMLLAFMRRNKLVKSNNQKNGVNRRKFKELVDFIGIYFVRCQISVPGGRPDEKEWLEWAQIFNSPDADTPTKRSANIKKVLTKLRKKAQDRPDDIVEKDLEKLTASPQRAKYIFRKLGYFDSSDDGEMQVEHILPSTWSEVWSRVGYNAETHKQFKSLLGNLTILEEEINNEIKNESWTVKKARYPESEVRQTRDLASKVNWRQIRIKERQEDLARLIIARWSVPPAP